MHPAALAVPWWLLKNAASENMNTLLKDAALFFYIVRSFRRERTHTHRDYNALNVENWWAFDAIGSVYYDY